MSFINKIFDLLFFPFKSFNPIVALIAASLLTGVLMLLILRYTSNQAGIKGIKNKLKAHFLELKLYKDNLGVILRAIGGAYLKILLYLKYFAVPILFSFIPFIFILVQIALRYEFRPLEPGETTILTVQLQDIIPDADTPVNLILPDGLKQDSNPVRIASEKMISWRLKILESGIFNAEIQVGDTSAFKRIVVSEKLFPLSSKRSKASIMEIVLNPAEPPIPAEKGITFIRVNYPVNRLPVSIFGMTPHWLLVYIVLFFVFGFALKGVLKVEW